MRRARSEFARTISARALLSRRAEAFQTIGDASRAFEIASCLDRPKQRQIGASTGESTMPRIILAVLLFALASPAWALDRVTFATNWRAQAEHGGFYQAVVDGTYARYGLDVKIQQGGPQTNARLLLAAGRVDFAMGANLIQTFEAVQQKIPVIVVASMFQIDPVILMSHPDVGFDRFEDLPKATAFIAGDMLASVYQWLKQAYGFREEKVKPYGFNPTPFIADPHSIEQGFLTSEPYQVERVGGFKPNVFCWPITATTAIRRRSRRAPRPSRRTPTSCNASSTRRLSAGAIIFMATTPPPTQRSSATIPR